MWFRPQEKNEIQNSNLPCGSGPRKKMKFKIQTFHVVQAPGKHKNPKLKPSMWFRPQEKNEIQNSNLPCGSGPRKKMKFKIQTFHVVQAPGKK